MGRRGNASEGMIITPSTSTHSAYGKYNMSIRAFTSIFRKLQETAFKNSRRPLHSRMQCEEVKPLDISTPSVSIKPASPLLEPQAGSSLRKGRTPARPVNGLFSRFWQFLKQAWQGAIVHRRPGASLQAAEIAAERDAVRTQMRKRAFDRGSRQRFSAAFASLRNDSL